MDPAPTLIYRRLNFVNGVPSEYSWTRPDIRTKTIGGLFLHRMNVEDWPEIYRQEKLLGLHVLPSTHRVDRPAAFGPCPCNECTTAREAEYRLKF
jgi:hypothetical protein